MKKIYGKFIAGIFTVLILMCVTGCGKKSIDVTVGMDVKFSGANGNGTAEVVFDSGDTYGYVAALLESGDESWQKSERLVKLAGAVTYEVSPNQGLSNGDAVTVHVNVDEAALKELGYSAKSETKTFSVTGLAELTEIDAFEGLKVVYKGVAPNARVDRIETDINQKLEGAQITFSYDKDLQLNIGDELVITATLSKQDKYILKETSKTFIVDGIDGYVMDPNAISAEALEEMHQIANTQWEERVQRNSKNGLDYLGFDLVDSQFWMSKEGFLERSNKYYLIYKVTTDAGPFYFYYQFINIMQHPDGTQSVELGDWPSVSDKLRVGETWEAGFESLEALNARIEEQLSYNCYRQD